MRDGVELLADRWHPTRGRAPLLVVRSPYGRRGMFGFQYGRLFAERGFQVLVQSCRGTFGSGGDFTPMVNEAADAEDTVAWLRCQPWFDGAFATVGASYLCFDQWALAASRPHELRAMVAQLGPHAFGPTIRPGGVFALDTALGFTAAVSGPERSLMVRLLLQVVRRRKLRTAYRDLPLIDSYRRALGRQVPFFERWLEHESFDDPLWQRMDHAAALEGVDAAVHLQGGWYDLFVSDTIAQYERLRARGLRPYLTMGPWSHNDYGMHAWATLMPDTLAWLRAHLGGSTDGVRSAPVRVFVLGAEEWREYEDWPPAGCEPDIWYLTAARGLSPSAPAACFEDRYTYDPADPTPAVGGGLLLFGAGPKDNRALEARADVLTYTSDPLPSSTTIFGAPVVEIHMRSTARSTDVFARVCDVAPSGSSVNVCDGVLRVGPDAPERRSDGSLDVRLTLSPTAFRFERGHRLRLQISSGAHPRFARNPGTGDPLATATRLVAQEQTVVSDPERPAQLSVLRA